MNEGWVKLYRKILDNPIVMKDCEYLGVWIYLLLNATHKEIPVIFNGKKKILKEGQLITGRKKISNELKIDESKTKRILLELENDHQIDRQRGAKSSLISIINWERYQQDDQQNDQQMTSNRPANDQQMTTNKNERIKEYNISSSPLKDFNTIWEKYPNKKGKTKAFDYYKQWIKGRKIDKNTIKLTNKQIWYAVIDYAKECEEDKTEQKYIKHGDTFFNKAIIDYIRSDEK